MTAPIQEPSTDRALQGIAYQRDQLLRRPAPAFAATAIDWAGFVSINMSLGTSYTNFEYSANVNAAGTSYGVDGSGNVTIGEAGIHFVEVRFGGFVLPANKDTRFEAAMFDAGNDLFYGIRGFDANGVFETFGMRLDAGAASDGYVAGAIVLFSHLYADEGVTFPVSLEIQGFQEEDAAGVAATVDSWVGIVRLGDAMSA